MARIVLLGIRDQASGIRDQASGIRGRRCTRLQRGQSARRFPPAPSVGFIGCRDGTLPSAGQASPSTPALHDSGLVSAAAHTARHGTHRLSECKMRNKPSWNFQIYIVILNSHRKIEKWSEQKLRQTRRRTQAGLTPGKDDNEVWHHFCRSRLKVSMGVQYNCSVGS